METPVDTSNNHLEIDIDTDSDFDNFIQDVIDNNNNNNNKPERNRKLSQSTTGKDSSNIPNTDNSDNISNVTENVKHFWEAYSESEDEGDDYTQSDNEERNNIKSPRNTSNSKFHKISIDKLKTKMNIQYDSLLVYNYSSALDILASYVKCHINIYMQASYNCTFMLNLFMMPCIFLQLFVVLQHLYHLNIHFYHYMYLI